MNNSIKQPYHLYQPVQLNPAPLLVDSNQPVQLVQPSVIRKETCLPAFAKNVLAGILLFLFVVAVGWIVLIVATGDELVYSVEGPSVGLGWVTHNDHTSSYFELHWKDHAHPVPLQQILIFDDVKEDYLVRKIGSHSSSDTDYDIVSGYASVIDDQDGDYNFDDDGGTTAVYQFRAITWRNGTIDFGIQFDAYDLEQGSVFLVTTKDGVKVKQVYAELSRVDTTSLDSVQIFAETNQDVIDFLDNLDEEYGN